MANLLGVGLSRGERFLVNVTAALYESDAGTFLKTYGVEGAGQRLLSWLASQNERGATHAVGAAFDAALDADSSACRTEFEARIWGEVERKVSGRYQDEIDRLRLKKGPRRLNTIAVGLASFLVGVGVGFVMWIAIP